MNHKFILAEQYIGKFHASHYRITHQKAPNQGCRLPQEAQLYDTSDDREECKNDITIMFFIRCKAAD